MFGQSAEPSPLWRICEPPEPVWVELAKVYEHVPGRPDAATSTLVRQRGLNPKDLTIGEVVAWARHVNGSWLALVSYVVPTVGLGDVPVRHYVARDALRKRGPKETEPPF